MAKQKPQANQRTHGDFRRRTRDDRGPCLPMTLSALAASVVTALVFVAFKAKPSDLSSPTRTEPTASATWSPAALLAAPEVPADADLALLNLSCCPSFTPESSSTPFAPYLKTLDDWAISVAEVTRNNYHRYLENPQEFASETEWKLAMMCTVLGQDFKVRYDPALISASQQRASNRVFFANPNLVFITGCLNDSRTGTCASLPVLYVAIGRRLGYPMHLVTAKTHLFARWDNGRDTVVNLEAANSGGFTNPPDSYYRTWPLPISPEEEKAGCYLKNLSAAQALAVFLTIRAASLQATG
jgi:hypothetical protein